MFTDLVNGEIVEEDGELRRLTLEQAVNFAALIGSAGTETVARMLGWAALTLDNNPDQRAELAADASLIPNAWRSCCATRRRHRCRAAGAPPTSRCTGGTIPARSKVVMITGSAGRDERAYPDADRFDIHRSSTTTCPSATASTSAWARRWPGRRGGSRSRRPSSASRSGRSTWPGRCRSTPAPSGATRSSRSRSDRRFDMRLDLGIPSPSAVGRGPVHWLTHNQRS